MCRSRCSKPPTALGGLVRTEHVDGFTIEAGRGLDAGAEARRRSTCATSSGSTPRLISPKAPEDRVRPARRPAPSAALAVDPRHSGDAGRSSPRYSLLPPPARVHGSRSSRWSGCRATAADESVAAFFRRRFGAVGRGRCIAQPLLGGIHAGRHRDAVAARIVSAARRRGTVRPRRCCAGSGMTARAGGRRRRSVAGVRHGRAGRRASSGGCPADAVRCRSPRDAALARQRTRGGGRSHAMGRRDIRRRDPRLPRARRRVDLLGDDRRSARRLCARGAATCRRSASRSAGRATRSRHPLNGSGFVVARSIDSVERITACTWVSSKWEGRAPAGHVLLRAYLGGAHDPAAVDLADDAAGGYRGARAFGDTVDQRRRLGSRASIAGANAGAQHEVGHLARMASSRQRLAAHAGLFVTGSGFRSIGIPDCIADGRASLAAASRLVGVGRAAVRR